MTTPSPWSTGPAPQDGRLAEIRHDRGLTREQVAERMGVPVARVVDVETGQDSAAASLADYARALGGTLRVAIHFEDGEVAAIS